MQALSNSVPEKNSTAMLRRMMWHERLTAKLKERNWTIPDLAREMGHADDKSMIDRLYKYTAGEVENPRGQTLPMIAKALGMTEIELRAGETQVPAAQAPAMGPDSQPFQMIHRDDLHASGRPDFPVYASAEGGPGQIIRSSDPVDFQPRPVMLNKVVGAYGLLVTGDSMDPEYRSGDTALVNPHLGPIGGEVFIFYAEHDGEARATIKHLRKATADKWLVSQHNPPEGMSKDFTLSRREWAIAHRVVGKYSRR